MRKILSVILFIFIISVSFGQTWSNPHILENEWSLYGIGDPYVLKYNGLFYLYCSTRDSETGVKVWSSRNLNDWDYEGLCTTEPITHGAYAPEVIHWGGFFYMYTSPAGNGHYILKSKSPIGPFEKTTGNLGHSIDGSVFKDDDGSLYFYHSGDDGIHAHKMNSPTSIGSEIILRETRMNGWTEGPCTIKRNGKYYMIYTGNHVISKGYRIDLATSNSSPTDSFVPDEYQNPVILNAEGDFVGLGHGSMFRGPNLDEYFITYHNLAGDFGVGPFRHLNFDRITFNNDRLIVHGPTNSNQIAPLMPDFFDYFDSEDSKNNWTSNQGQNWIKLESAIQLNTNNNGWNVLLNSITPNTSYNAEFNIKESSANEALLAGVIFNYTDENNYGLAVLNKENNDLQVSFTSNNQVIQSKNVDLSGVDDYSIWHSIRIEKNQDEFEFFVDDMLKVKLKQEMPSGQIGYAVLSASAQLSFCAISNQTNGGSSYDVAKPIPGTIAAVHYINGEKDIAYHVNNEKTNSYRFDEVNLENTELGGYSVTAKAGDWFIYNTMVDEKAEFNIGMIYSTSSANCKVKIWQANEYASKEFDLLSTDGKFMLIPLGHIALNGGEQKMKIEVLSGEISFYSLKFQKYAEIAEWSDEFDKSFSYHWKYKDGDWTINSKAALAKNSSKRTMGDNGWTDYSLVVDVKYTVGMNGGLMFRTTNQALGGPGNNPDLGTDFFQGYYVTLERNGVSLGKHNYNYKLLAKSNGNYKQNNWYRLAVTVKGNNIKVFVDDMSNPIIDYIDEFPFMSGKAGLRTHNSTVLFNNFKIIKGDVSDLSTSFNNIEWQKGINIFPNPTENELYISHNGSISKAEIFTLNGTKIRECYGQESLYVFELKGQPKGTYLLKTTDFSNRSLISKLLLF